MPAYQNLTDDNLLAARIRAFATLAVAGLASLLYDAGPAAADSRLVDGRKVALFRSTLPPAILAPAIAAGAPPATERASVDSARREAAGNSIEPALSATGRFVAFESDAPNLVGGDTNGTADIFVRDRRTGVTERVSVSSSGVQGDGQCHLATVSGSGRFVAFESSASNLVRGDTNGSRDVFVHDRRNGRTLRVSVSSRAREGNGASGNAWISADGRVVAFQSDAPNLVRGDENGVADVFVHDRESGVTTRVSVGATGTQGDAGSFDPVTSTHGRWVAFTSEASNLVRGDTNEASDVFLYDRVGRRARRVSVSSSGAQGNGASLEAELAPRAGHVAFSSVASNLVGGDTNEFQDVFVYSRRTRTTKRISVGPSGAQGNDRTRRPGYFAGTRFVAFQSFASNLVRGDNNNAGDVFVHDRASGRTRRVSVNSAGAEGNCLSAEARVSADGRFAAFASCASNLVGRDENERFDVFVRGPLVRQGLPGRIRAGAALSAAETMQVNARVVLGFTNENMVDVEATGLVEGRPFRRAAMELRTTFSGLDASGRFTLFDGRGSLRGRAQTHTDDAVRFSGTFSVEGGSGRYARAAGTLRFRGALDSERVPAVTVMPGRIEGRLRVRAAAPPAPRTRPLAIDFRGKEAKVHFRQISTEPFLAKLTHAGATAMDRFGRGVLLKTLDIDLRTQRRPAVITWYGPDGTWTVKGTPNLDTGPTGSDRLRVTGGTGRYRGARGALAHTWLTEPSFSGLSIARLRGKLRFP